MDETLLTQLAYLESLDKLIESKAQEYLNPDRIFSVLNVDYRNVENLQAQQAKFASDFLFYNGLAAKLKCMKSKYEDIVFNKCMAHFRKWASIYMTSISKRDTKEALNDYAMWMFSEDTTEDEKRYYSNACANHFNTPASEDQISKISNSMYQNTRTYEDLITEKSKFDYRAELAMCLAESIKNVNICASQIVKLRLSGSGEAPSISVDTVKKLRNIIEKNPNISDDQLHSFIGV